MLLLSTYEQVYRGEWGVDSIAMHAYDLSIIPVGKTYVLTF